MKKYIVFILVVVFILPIIASCDRNAQKQHEVETVDTVTVDTSVVKVEKVEEEPVKTVEKKEKPIVKKEEPKQDAPKKVEVPQEIGASPDAVYSLDDNETESSPKYLDGEKKLKKLLKKQLRKGKKGENGTGKNCHGKNSDDVVIETESDDYDEYEEAMVEDSADNQSEEVIEIDE